MTTKQVHGGKRPNQTGRPTTTLEQKQEFAAKRRQELSDVLVDELIFPAVCTAFHADPGRWQERILTFELSGTQIREAYGNEGLKEWKSYFSQQRRGGCDQRGNGYKTLWRFNTGKYSFILKIVESLGHSIKDLPKPGFPPNAMLARLAKVEAHKAALKAKKLQGKVEKVLANRV